MHGDQVVERVFEVVSKFQHIKLERVPDFGITLYLDGYWQFSEVDIPTYHEPLALWPGMCSPKGFNALILGGGDGLAAAELLKLDVGHIDLVEIDPEMIGLAKRSPVKELNEAAFSNKKVDVAITDARKWLNECKKDYDLIVVDFPSDLLEPPDHMDGLYSDEIFSKLYRALKPTGILSIQLSMPYVKKQIKLRKLLSIWSFVKVIDVGYVSGDSDTLVHCSQKLMSWDQRPKDKDVVFLNSHRREAIENTPYLDNTSLKLKEHLCNGLPVI